MKQNVQCATMYNNSVQRFAAQISNSLYIERANQSANRSENRNSEQSRAQDVRGCKSCKPKFSQFTKQLTVSD